MIVFSHPTGNADVRQTALALYEGELLSEFWTCINWNPDTALARLLPARVRRQFERRAFLPATRPLTHGYPWREVGRLFAPALHLEFLTRHESGFLSVDAVFQSLDAKVAKRLSKLPDVRGVYAKEDGALDSFRVAKSRGLKCFYELPIGYWRAGHEIYNEEKEREPEWAATLTGMRDSPAKLARKDEELQLADVVLVASSFTRSTLKSAPPVSAPVYVTPYGAPEAVETPNLERADASRLKVLFVGALSQRKGLSYLLRAMEMLRGRADLTIIGQKMDAPCAPLDAALRQHRWIKSLPHAEILREMRGHDVLAFPSLFEGFGLVIAEAMSQGIPVIATPHTAGPDIISDGEDGFVVPVRCAEAIAEKLTWMLENPDALREMKLAAWNKAKVLAWEEYRASLRQIIRSTID